LRIRADQTLLAATTTITPHRFSTSTAIVSAPTAAGAAGAPKTQRGVTNAAIAGFSIAGALVGVAIIGWLAIFLIRTYNRKRQSASVPLDFAWFRKRPERRDSFLDGESTVTPTRSSIFGSSVGAPTREGGGMEEWQSEVGAQAQRDPHFSRDLPQQDMSQVYAQPSTWTDQLAPPRSVRQPAPDFVLENRHQLSYIPEEASRRTSFSSYRSDELFYNEARR
jgi:hypothetical protein